MEIAWNLEKTSMSLKVKRAVTILSGWLEAANVPFEVNGSTGLLVRGKEGEFVVDISETYKLGSILAADLVAPIEKSIPCFWNVTEKAGYGKPQVLNCRGASPEKVKYSNNPELIAMRHREFRQVANLPLHVYQDVEYQRIIGWYCRRFFDGNKDLCHRVGYDKEDIKTYSWLYLTNFYGRWRHMDADPHSNHKMFCSYLQQRLYSDLKPLMVRKAKSTSVDLETASIGQNVDFAHQYASDGGEGSVVPVAVARPQEFELQGAMDSMDHDDLIDILKSMVNNGNSKVKRFLTMHREECMDCCTRVECRKPISKNDAEDAS
jgi:hypothetical protein